MKETVERSLEAEEKKGGLVIIKGLYGKLITDDDGYVTLRGGSGGSGLNCHVRT